MDSKTERWLALPEVAEQLSLSLTTVRRLVVSGALPARRFKPRLLRVKASDLRDWLESCPPAKQDDRACR